MSTPGSNRFYVQLQEGATAEETATRTMQELIRLVSQLNDAMPPISIGPNQDLPEGMQAGQPIINWGSGSPILQVFDGNTIQSS